MLRTRWVAALGAALLFSTAGMAKLGVGLHWGNDLSLQMDDALREQAVFEGISLSLEAITGTNPGGFDASISGDDLPIYISRTDWKRQPFNVGAKVFIDIIPMIDALEVSGNFGVWEYQGSIMYPTGIAFSGVSPSQASSPDELFDVTYDTLALTLEQFGLDYVGMSGTPYAKLNLDLSVRKYLVQFPRPLKTLRLYAGGGASVHYATPMLSAGLIEKALGEKLETAFASVQGLGPDLLGDIDVMEAVVKEIIAGLVVPRFGMHLMAGAMVKIPVLPLFAYLDTKLMIPFGQMDPDVGDLRGVGLLVNAGAGLYF